MVLMIEMLSNRALIQNNWCSFNPQARDYDEPTFYSKEKCRSDSPSTFYYLFFFIITQNDQNDCASFYFFC